MTDTTTRTRRTRTPEQRERLNAYQRRYRAEHPDATRAWRDAYVLRRAAKLQAEMNQNGGAERGGD